MSMWRKKPVVIEAVQLRWDTWSEVCDFIKLPWGPDGVHGIPVKCGVMDDSQTEQIGLVIPTLEGNITAAHGDWIIKGINGEYYPCKPDIFAKTYEPAETVLTMPGEFINRDETLKTLIGALYANGSHRDYIQPQPKLGDDEITEAVLSVPATNAVPAMSGSWIPNGYGEDCEPQMRCSRCGRTIMAVYVHDCPYCHCGARMDGVKNHAE